MELTAQRQQELESLCCQFRKDVFTAICHARSGHPGGSLSVCEILTLLYQHRMHIPYPQDPDRDRLVLCKAHAAPMLYRNLIEKRFLPGDCMDTLRRFGSPLQGCPTTHTPGVDLPSGPPGIGLAAAQGMALGLRMNGSSARVYAILGDGELDEGTVWEAAASSAGFGLDNLCAVVDCSRIVPDGTTDKIMPPCDIGARWQAFGWHVIRADGHDLRALDRAFDDAEAAVGCPAVIIADTVMGKGVSFLEGQAEWHEKVIDDDSCRKVMAELGGAD